MATHRNSSFFCFHRRELLNPETLSFYVAAPMPRSADSQEPLHDLLIFHELAGALTSNLDLAAVLRTVRSYMDRFIEADLWALLMLDHDRRELYYADIDGNRDPRLVNARIRVGEGLAGWVAEHGETLIIPEVQMGPEVQIGPEVRTKPEAQSQTAIPARPDPRLAPAAQSRSLAVQSAIGLPIRGSRGTHGVVEIFNPRLGEKSDYNIAFLHILVDFAAIAIENAKDVARTQQLTITDDATGLYNARHLYAVLERELEAARKDSRPLSLVFLDLDRFKLVNDAHGHLIGTELLGQVGRCIRELCRSTDLCFRYGGDEFVALLRGLDKPAAAELATKIRAELIGTQFLSAAEMSLSITGSFGLATFPQDGDSLHEIIRSADTMMYHAKSEGRNRIAVADPERLAKLPVSKSSRHS